MSHAADVLRRKVREDKPIRTCLMPTQVLALADLVDAALGMYDWLISECLPPGAEYAAEGHLFSMNIDDLERGRAMEAAGGTALEAVEDAFEAEP